MRYPLLAILCVVSCNSQEIQVIEFPSGGYAYPTTIKKNGEDFVFYPLKDSLSKSDSFRTAYYGSYLLKAVNEPNLSLKSQGQTIFRFIYEGPMEQPLVVNFTENAITVKEGVKGTIYPQQDENNLSEIERQHFNLLRWRFPLTDSTKNKKDNQYIDSLVKIYPHLLDPSYYKSLLKKIELPITDKFTYTTKKVNISSKEFRDLVDTINSSGYWNFPFEIPCSNMPADVSWYSLEANTRNKYNVVTELDCDVTNFKILCRKLLSFAKVKQRF